MIENKYLEQTKLMLRILPHVAKEECFALKGGTAINLFIRDMPRLSVDIDLAYLPIEKREESLKNIGRALDKIADKLKTDHKVRALTATEPKGVREELTFTNKLVIASKNALIKIEPNIIFRGAVFPTEKRTLVKPAQDKFGLTMTVPTLSTGDLYGGKICAALDRQHPRDLFDVKLLLENEGLSDNIRRSFIIYLAGHNRPIHELLDPNLKNIKQEYENDFLGMSGTNISYKELVECQKNLPNLIKNMLLEKEKRFLISIAEGEPIWELFDVDKMDKLPALQWRLDNIQKFKNENKRKWNEQLQKLRSILTF